MFGLMYCLYWVEGDKTRHFSLKINKIFVFSIEITSISFQVRCICCLLII